MKMVSLNMKSGPNLGKLVNIAKLRCDHTLATFDQKVIGLAGRREIGHLPKNMSQDTVPEVVFPTHDNIKNLAPLVSEMPSGTPKAYSFQLPALNS